MDCCAATLLAAGPFPMFAIRTAMDRALAIPFGAGSAEARAAAASRGRGA